MKNVICLLVLLLLFSCNGKPKVQPEEDGFIPYNEDEVRLTTLALDSAETLMNQTFSLELMKKEYVKVGSLGYFDFTFKVKNKSTNPIKAVKGSLMFCDLFDEYITGYDYTYDKKILMPGDFLIFKDRVDANILRDERPVIEKQLTSLKVTWFNHSILFENDSVVNKDDLVELFKKKLGE